MSTRAKLSFAHSGSASLRPSGYSRIDSIVALLMWIYLSGSLIILGGCLCAARYEIKMSLTDQSERNRAR